jgi:4-hydroxybutyryl-CoA dehydratase/vinylacetyl-CoA-Delta-isomerase
MEMTHLRRPFTAAPFACSNEGRATPSGAYLAEPMLANITKERDRNIYEICPLAQDIAGGLMATLPPKPTSTTRRSGHSYQVPEGRKESIPNQDKDDEAYREPYRRLLPLSNQCMGQDPQAQKIMIYRNSSIKG